MKKTIALLFACVLFKTAAMANITLPTIFGDNMVLQRNKPISIWGLAAPNEKVSVQFNKQTKNTIANKAGKWQLFLPITVSRRAFEQSLGRCVNLSRGRNKRRNEAVQAQVWSVGFVC